MGGTRRRFMLLALCFLYTTSCSQTRKVSLKSSLVLQRIQDERPLIERVKRNTGRAMNRGVNSVRTFRGSNQHARVAGISNGQSMAIGGVLGQRESKALGDSLRQGIRTSLPFVNRIRSNIRGSSSGVNTRNVVGNVVKGIKESVRKTHNSIGNQMHGNNGHPVVQSAQHGMVTNSMNRGGKNTVSISNRNGRHGRNKNIGKAHSGSQSHNIVGMQIQSNQHVANQVRNKGRNNNQNEGGVNLHSGRNSVSNSSPINSNHNGQTSITQNSRRRMTGSVQNRITNVNRKVHNGNINVNSGISNSNRLRSSNAIGASKFKGMSSSHLSNNGRLQNRRSNTASINNRGFPVPSQNNNGMMRKQVMNQRNIGHNNRASSNVFHNNFKTNGHGRTMDRGFVRNTLSGGHPNGVNINVHDMRDQFMNNRQSNSPGLFQGMIGGNNFHVSAGMQSNIRRRMGGIPSSFTSNSNFNGGKRVVIQNGRRIILSSPRRIRRPSRPSSSGGAVAQVVDPVELTLENMDIENIIGLASQIATVKLANSVLSSVNIPMEPGLSEAIPLAPFLLDAELDIMPEIVIHRPKVVQSSQNVQRSRPIIIRQNPRPQVIRTTQIQRQVTPVKSVPVVMNEVSVSAAGYGTPVLVRSGGSIEFSKIDQSGKRVSSITISGNTKSNTSGTTANGNVNGNKSQTNGNGNAKTEATANGGNSQQAPLEEVELEPEAEGLTTKTTARVSTASKAKLIPPTTTVANSVVVV